MAATIASNSQVWIASQLSATAADARPPRTHWNYVRDRNGMTVIDPVLGFYFNPPKNARCRWSTDNGARAPQHIRQGVDLDLPRRTLVLWNDMKLESEAARIRQKYWEEMRTLVAPQRFEDLYEYFDSATLWTSGAVNLWNLINLLANDARQNWREVEKHVASECNNWVLDWLETFPAAETNRESLIKWDQKSDILTAVTSQFDWEYDLQSLDLVGQNVLRECFLYHFERLTGAKPNVARFNTYAAEDKPIIARNSATVSVDTTAKASASPEDAPPPSSPVQALATIPEDTAAVKTATKAKDLTIDTSVSAQTSNHTVSAPATAVPRIVIEPQPAKEAEDVPEAKDRKDTTEDEFLTNQDLADRVQSTVRQLSSQSTPGESQDSMLSAPTHGIQARVVSAPETTQGHQLQRTFPEKPGTVARNMKENKPPFRGPPKSPQGYGPHRQQTSANMLTFRGGPPIPHQKAPMGPSHQQHTMQPFGPLQNGMPPPPPGLVPPTSTHGMPAYPEFFTPQAQGFHPGVGLEQMPGLSGPEFQNQMPMRPPHMGQPGLSHSQAPPTGMPPQYMGQHNVGTPMYQPNGYIPRPQHQPGGGNGNKKMRRDVRRDSTHSSGSRSKLRDDPIHGPVYSMKSRKDSNTSTVRQSSNLDRSPATDPKQSASGAHVECKNYRHGDNARPHNFDFVECPCFQCVRSSKSLFVKHGKLDRGRVEKALMDYFAGWGVEHVVMIQGGTGSLVVLHSDHDTIRAMRDLYARPNQGRDIPGLGLVSRIWYALYSKHFATSLDNPAGLPRGLLEDNTGRRRSSSALSRDSNPYRNQQPKNTLVNPLNFANRGPGIPPSHFWRGETGGPPNLDMVPMYQQPPQRGLWVPDDVDPNRRPSKMESTSKDVMAYQPKTYPKRPDGITALREDWRSKPRAEEVIDDISSDDAAAEVSSNVSSQGARSVKVCLPNEAGSSRSRSSSPNAGDHSVKKQVQKNPSNSSASASQKGSQAERSSAQDSKAEAAVKDDVPVSSSYRKATAELAVPVEEFQPTAVPERKQFAEQHGKESLSCYSKVTSQLTEATEEFDLNTVIRHKPARGRLPEEWMGTSEHKLSNLQDRFGALTGALQQDGDRQELDSTVTEGTSVAVNSEAPRTEEAPTQQAKKNSFKGGRNRKSKPKLSNGSSTSAASSATSTEVQSRGPSRTSNNRPTSRASTARPESANGMANQSSSRPQSATQGQQGPSSIGGRNQPTKKKKNVKAQRKSKESLAAESSAATVGQAKTGGSQDHVRAVSGQEPPTKKLKTLQSEPATETVSEPTKSADDVQSKAVVKEHDDSKESSSQDNTGGLARLENQSPQMPPEQSNSSDDKLPSQEKTPTPLQTKVEPPARNDRDHGSPEANLFPNQKFTIDKVKEAAAMAPTLIVQESHERHRQPSTVELTTNDGRIALPLLPPNAKPPGWATAAARGARSKSDDPFATVQSDPQSGDWLKDKAVKSAQKPSSEPVSHQTSPTPSPEKKTGHRGGSTKLNASAKAFAPTSLPSSPAESVASVLSGKALPFHVKKPSLPGQKGAVEQRFITPADQVVDPTTVTQPGPPTKEKKRAGPAPDRGGNGDAKERAKPSEAGSAPSSTKAVSQAASAARAAPKAVDKEEFPTLAAAVSKPPVTSPNNVKLGQRGEVSAPAAAKQDGGDKAKAGEHKWTTVVRSGKKAGGKNNGGGSNNNNRPTSGRSGGGATGQGRRGGGQGNRGGRPPVGEERMGG